MLSNLLYTIEGIVSECVCLCVRTQVLGTPTREQIREMNPNYTEFKFPQIKAHPWTKVSQPSRQDMAVALRLPFETCCKCQSSPLWL